MNLKQAVVFAILMQGNGGILSKAPSYVLEKLQLCELGDTPEYLLDDLNREVFERYFEKWKVNKD